MLIYAGNFTRKKNMLRKKPKKHKYSQSCCEDNYRVYFSNCERGYPCVLEIGDLSSSCVAQMSVRSSTTGGELFIVLTFFPLATQIQFCSIVVQTGLWLLELF